MKPFVPGIHHVTAIAGKTQANVNFYRDLLGLRLVKKTVNFDDNYTYHLYFGDGKGSPGTAMTFFPWEHAHRGRNGRGLTKATAFAVPEGSLDFWKSRLESASVKVEETVRFGKKVLQFADHDGLLLELEENKKPAQAPWETSEIPSDKAINGFAGVTLNSIAPAVTSQFLSRILGFKEIGSEGSRIRFAPSGDAQDSWIDVLETKDEAGKFGAGIVHHVAFRTQSDAEQQAWIEHLYTSGIQVTGVKDRQYFRSIYFHEPGGVLFEIATDGPGFLVDEDEIALGTALKLPSWVEPRRSEIEAHLPVLK